MEQMLLKFLQPISDSAVEAIEACLAAAIVHPAIIMFGSTPAIMRLLLPHTCERLEKKSARAEQERERRKEVEDVRIVKRRLFGTDGKESAHVEAMLAEKERESQWALEKSKQLARRIKKLEDSAMQTSNEVQAGVAGGTARRHLRRPTRY